MQLVGAISWLWIVTAPFGRSLPRIVEGGRTEELIRRWVCIILKFLDDRDFSGVVGDSAISGFFFAVAGYYGINPEVNLVREIC